MNLALLTLAALPLPPADTPTWPLDPRPEVVRGFDLPAKPWLPGHRGVDLAGHPGQAVRAATSGTITYAGSLAGRGVVTITSGQRRTTYEPVVPEVKPGTAVTPGTVLGRLSSAGSHCPPRTCLHWGLLQSKQYLNPLTLLPDRPIRLLPLGNQLIDVAPHQSTKTASPEPAQTATRPARSTATPPTEPPPANRRAATLVIAATAALTLTTALLLHRG
ncbi:M23 family metallopeptidase [Kribbella sp. NPDC048915]|uniref:M23 family metallopeptidase n=1 Tax=Kribbella sp. NPDC048915 TaxID=3155148 RepID=UPI0033C10212